MIFNAELEQWLAIGAILFMFTACVDIYWLLASGRVEMMRRLFAHLVLRWQKDYRVESYIKELKKLTDENLHP